MLAVTTHSQTRNLRSTLSMLVAGRRIERELRDAPGCERYANVFAGPREFWTLTIWREAEDMHRCMRSGIHGRAMWSQPYWLECYWGMRWRPGPFRGGEWEGDPWSWLGHPADGEHENAEEPESPPDMPPWMQSALGRTVPLERRRLAGAAGATYRLRVPAWRFPAALSDVRRLRRTASQDPDSFALSLGFGTGGALYLLVIARSHEALGRLRESDEHRRFLERWGDRAWCSEWEPESEFGNWRSHRLRDGQLTDEPMLVDRRLPVQATAAREARAVLRDRLATLDRASSEVVQLLTSELVANGTRHAGLEPRDEIGLRVRAERDWVRIEVIDRGRQFEPHVPLTKSAGAEPGWGLFLVNKLADRWGVSDGGGERQVWFEVRVPVADHAAAA